jgi:hypothetical protein
MPFADWVMPMLVYLFYLPFICLSAPSHYSEVLLGQGSELVIIIFFNSCV